MPSTQFILISIVICVLFCVVIWSTNDNNSNITSITTIASTKSTRSSSSKNTDEEEQLPSTAKKIRSRDNDDDKDVPLQFNSVDENNKNGNDESDKYWTLSQMKYNEHGRVVKSISALSKEIHQNVRQCRPLGTKFIQEVAKWLIEIQYQEHYDNNQNENINKDDDGQESSRTATTKLKSRTNKRLIYSCESHRRGKFCGGMGDRFRGMVSSAFLALLSNRRYEIFHPVPVPLQQFLRPRYIDWIPRVRMATSSKKKKSSNLMMKGKNVDDTILRHAKSYQELDDHMQSITLHRELMNIKTHKKFIPYFLAPSPAGAGDLPENVDLRIQSNTPGFDKYVLRDQQSVLRKRFLEELGLPLQCNLTCYYGCMSGLLFEPSDELEKEMNRALKGFEVVDDQKSNGLSGDENSANKKQEMNNRKKKMIPLSQAVVETHRGIRQHPVPVLGLQVRVGGSWASNFTAKEPFRTVPAAFPFIFQDVRFLIKYDISRNKNKKKKNSRLASLSSSASPDDETNNRRHGGSLPVFVTSDSSRFIIEAEKALANNNVFSISGDCFQHTDTQNVNEAIPEKYKHLNTKQHQRRAAYLCTLMNHVILSASEVLVMGQSGFADTAFWSGRSYGVGFFMDMTNNKIAWEHTLEYEDDDNDDNDSNNNNHEKSPPPSPAVSRKNRIVDVTRDNHMVKKQPFFK